MHGQGNHPNGLVALKHRIPARMAFFGQDRLECLRRLVLGTKLVIHSILLLHIAFLRFASVFGH
jgi:hypothetical protein